MWQRLIISENEKNRIMEMYGFINEGAVVALLNKASDKIANSITNAVNGQVLPKVIPQINKNIKYSYSTELWGETYSLSFNGSISGAKVGVGNLQFTSTEQKQNIGFTYQCGLVGTFSSVADIVGVKSNNTINFTGSVVRVSGNFDWEFDEEILERLQVTSISLNVNIPETPLTYEDNGKNVEILKFSIKDNNTLYTTSGDLGDKEFALPINSEIANYIKSNPGILTFSGDQLKMYS